MFPLGGTRPIVLAASARGKTAFRGKAILFARSRQTKRRASGDVWARGDAHPPEQGRSFWAVSGSWARVGVAGRPQARKNPLTPSLSPSEGARATVFGRGLTQGRTAPPGPRGPTLGYFLSSLQDFRLRRRSPIPARGSAETKRTSHPSLSSSDGQRATVLGSVTQSRTATKRSNPGLPSFIPSGLGPKAELRGARWV